MASTDQLQVDVADLHRKGKYREALDLVEAAGEEASEDAAARLAFWRACLLSLCGEPDEALRVLEAAAEAGCWWHPEQLRDDDLVPLRDDSRFRDLQQVSREQYERASATPPPQPLEFGEDRVSQHVVVGLHRAGSSPRRAASLWAPLADDGWRVLLPNAPYSLNSGERLWLDPSRGELDFQAAADAVVPYVPDVADSLVIGGFAQGGAIALDLALTGLVTADAVVLVAATHRYVEVIERAHDSSPKGLRVWMFVGDGERHADSARDAANRLRELGLDVNLDVLSGVDHVVPEGLPQLLPTLLFEEIICRRR